MTAAKYTLADVKIEPGKFEVEILNVFTLNMLKDFMSVIDHCYISQYLSVNLDHKGLYMVEDSTIGGDI